MRQQLTNLDNQARQPLQKVVHPNYQKVRSLVLNKLKIGSQSPSAKAIDAFIKQLQKETE